MNLIEAWKQAKEGQKIKRQTWDKSYLTKTGNCQNLSFIYNDCACEYSPLGIDLLADDWEILREKKKVVIERVIWKFDKVYYPDKKGSNVAWSDLMEKPPMTMTLEWEE